MRTAMTSVEGYTSKISDMQRLEDVWLSLQPHTTKIILLTDVCYILAAPSGNVKNLIVGICSLKGLGFSFCLVCFKMTKRTI